MSSEAAIILTSDHGESFGEHDYFAHELLLYENLIRVPLIVSTAPGEVRSTDDAVQLVDIFLTVLDVLALPRSESVDGVSLRPLLQGRPVAEDRPAFGSYLNRGFKRYFLRTSRWKLIWSDRPPK